MFSGNEFLEDFHTEPPLYNHHINQILKPTSIIDYSATALQTKIQLPADNSLSGVCYWSRKIISARNICTFFYDSYGTVKISASTRRASVCKYCDFLESVIGNHCSDSFFW